MTYREADGQALQVTASEDGAVETSAEDAPDVEQLNSIFVSENVKSLRIDQGN